MSIKILFILKRREDFDPTKHTVNGLSTGLFNSASFMVKMLNDSGISAEIEVAIDNNCIDRLVTRHKPTHVIIEALWVVPSKFPILVKLHPTVKWIVRLHSELPFLAGEGMAMDWIGDYFDQPNLFVGVNAPRMLSEIRTFLKIKNGLSNNDVEKKVFYLPNFYPQEYKSKTYDLNTEYVNIGCFGAIRPLKNHMIQAIAALDFADLIGKKLKFHINVGRNEMKGEPVFNNLKSLFQHLHDKGHLLVQHEWVPRDEFLEVCAQMDIGIQVSFSETFNIVGADLISQGVPIVGSLEIPWLTDVFAAVPANGNSILNALLLTHRYSKDNVEENQISLTEYTTQSRKVWVNYFS